MKQLWVIELCIKEFQFSLLKRNTHILTHAHTVILIETNCRSEGCDVKGASKTET